MNCFCFKQKQKTKETKMSFDTYHTFWRARTEEEVLRCVTKGHNINETVCGYGSEWYERDLTPLQYAIVKNNLEKCQRLPV